MIILQLGRVLLKMASYAATRANVRRDALGEQNSELLYSISHMLHEGAVACEQIAKENADQP